LEIRKCGVLIIENKWSTNTLALSV